jgi:hypothetical protein
MDPAAFGFPRRAVRMVGGDAEANAASVRAVSAASRVRCATPWAQRRRRDGGPAGLTSDAQWTPAWEIGVERAVESIDSGAAERLLANMGAVHPESRKLAAPAGAGAPERSSSASSPACSAAAALTAAAAALPASGPERSGWVSGSAERCAPRTGQPAKSAPVSSTSAPPSGAACGGSLCCSGYRLHDRHRGDPRRASGRGSCPCRMTASSHRHGRPPRGHQLSHLGCARQRCPRACVVTAAAVWSRSPGGLSYRCSAASARSGPARGERAVVGPVDQLGRVAGQARSGASTPRGDGHGASSLSAHACSALRPSRAVQVRTPDRGPVPRRVSTASAAPRTVPPRGRRAGRATTENRGERLSVRVIHHHLAGIGAAVVRRGVARPASV